MVSETATFGSATVLTVVGLVVMLYGVSLDAGTSLNSTMAVGGLVAAAGVAVIMVGVVRLEAGHEAE